VYHSFNNGKKIFYRFKPIANADKKEGIQQASGLLPTEVIVN
jgi:hypothetical protein